MNDLLNKPTWPNSFGVKVIKNLFTKSEIDIISENVSLLEQYPDKKNYIWKFYEKNIKRLNRIEYFVKFNKFFFDLANDEKLLEIANELLGEKSILFKDKINFKYPGGEGFAPHQDVSAGWGMYSNKHVNIAIPLSDTNVQNGCIYFGSCMTDMKTDYFQDLSEDSLNLEKTETFKGDIICFDSYIPHSSYANNSNQKRVILFFTYTPFSNGDFYEKYHADKFKNVPPDIYREKGKKYRSGNTNIPSAF
tara:strand:- start:2409 stop:3155 length:747 start_codon:yes stop_codon:yes gene_type:complete